MDLKCRYKIDYSSSFKLDTIKRIFFAKCGGAAVGAAAFVPHILRLKDGKDIELVAMGASQTALSIALGMSGLVMMRCCRRSSYPKRLFLGLGIPSAIFAALNIVAFIAYIVLGVRHLHELSTDKESLPGTVDKMSRTMLAGLSRLLYVQLSLYWTVQGVKAARIAYAYVSLLHKEEESSESFPTPPSTPGFAKEAGMVPVHQTILNNDTEMYF